MRSFFVFFECCQENETCGRVAGMGKLGNANFIGRDLELCATCESAYGDTGVLISP